MTDHQALNMRHCNACGHDWIPRVIYPKCCPACLSRVWSQPGPHSKQPEPQESQP